MLKTAYFIFIVVQMVKKALKPAMQGDYDAFCGFYSIANAILLLFPDIDQADVFDVMFAAYIENYNNSHATDLLYGIYRSKLNFLLNHVIQYFELPCTVIRPFWSRKAVTLEAFVDKIRAIQDPPDSCMIIGYEYGLEKNQEYFSHWTVIKHISASGKNLLIVDSSYQKSRIPLKDCRLWDAEYSKDKPYRISSTDTFIIKRTDYEKV